MIIQIDLIKKLIRDAKKLVQKKGNGFGRWTVAELYRQMIAIHSEYYSIKILATWYRKSKKGQITNNGWDGEQNSILRKYRDDIVELTRWVDTTDGLKYSPATTECKRANAFKQSNDLYWPQWALL